ncbi:MAG: hypothetical protein WAV73_04665 [Candidatus Moraniibacteriota bacterium]
MKIVDKIKAVSHGGWGRYHYYHASNGMIVVWHEHISCGSVFFYTPIAVTRRDMTHDEEQARDEAGLLVQRVFHIPLRRAINEGELLEIVQTTPEIILK